MIANRVETGSGIGFGATVKAKSDKASEGELLAQAEPEDLDQVWSDPRVWSSAGCRNVE